MTDPKVPNVLSDRERASMVVGRLEALQREEFSLEVERVASSREPNEVYQPGGPDREDVTYAAQADRLAAAQKKLLSENSDLGPAIEKLLEERKAAAAAEEKAREQQRADAARG